MFLEFEVTNMDLIIKSFFLQNEQTLNNYNLSLGRPR